jgi:hypothetical protein
LKLNLFKPGMAVVFGRFTGKIIRLDVATMTVRWDSGILEVLGEQDLARKDLRPMFP